MRLVLDFQPCFHSKITCDMSKESSLAGVKPATAKMTEKPTDTESSPSTGDPLETGQVEIVQLDTQVIRRDIGPLRIIAIGFNIPNSWVAIAASLSIAIAAGGTVSVIYGTFVSCGLYFCAAITLAELASVYPTAGGQYHFTSILAPRRFNRAMSYACGVISTLSWAINGASVTLIASQIITAFPGYFDGYVPEPWHHFLIYQALNMFTLSYNLFALKRTGWIHDAAFMLTIATFSISAITSVARSERAPSSWVWTNFEVNTGWTPAVSFLTGLTTPCYMYGGLDAALHLAEETLNPHETVPRALMATIGIGFVTAFSFAVAMSYCITDLESLLSDSMPIYKLWRSATRSDAAATIFLVALAMIVTHVIVAIQQTSSRLIWAFARDRGTVAATRLSRLSAPLGDIPANALCLNAALVFLCGCLYLGSSAAFNALVGSFLLLQMVSFAFPAALLLYRRRSPEFLPPNRAFRVPEVLGWACNIGTLVGAAIETVFFTFPPALPVDARSMNYAVVVLGAVAIFSVVNWFAVARKTYQGPRIEMAV